jgi:predicted nucleotidyltransferase
MNEMISYASDFASFFIGKTKNIKKIAQIILFGSAVRGEERKDSDIDLFIDVLEDAGKIEREVSKIKEDFFNSARYEKYWKLLNIKNDFSIITGKIDEWKLKDSIYGDAIILYGKYSPKINEGENKAIFSWENVKPNSKRVLLNKQIFGHNLNGKHYNGVIDIYSGEKLSKGTIIFNAKYIKEVLDIFRKYKIKVKINKCAMWQ